VPQMLEVALVMLGVAVGAPLVCLEVCGQLDADAIHHLQAALLTCLVAVHLELGDEPSHPSRVATH